MQNFCGKCGTKLSSELKFCTNCGAPIQTNVEPSNKEIPIKIVAKEDTKAEKEVAAEKKSFDTQPYISKDQSFELKIKKISIILLSLFASLFIAGFILNYIINTSLKFDINNADDIKEYIELRRDANSLAKQDKYYLNYFGDASTYQILDDMIALNKKADYYFSTLHFEDAIKISLLILVMMVLTIASTELIKDLNVLKWVLVFGNLLVGVIFTYIIVSKESSFFGYNIGSRSNGNTLLLYISISASIAFCILIFYNIKKIIYWVLVPSVTGLLLAFGSIDYTFHIGYYGRAAFSTPLFYMLRYLFLIAFIVLPSISFYLFLKEIIYKKEPQELVSK